MATVCLPYTRGASATRSSRGHEVQEWLCESTRRRRAAQITAEESQPTRAGSALTGRPRDESRPRGKSSHSTANRRAASQN